MSHHVLAIFFDIEKEAGLVFKYVYCRWGSKYIDMRKSSSARTNQSQLHAATQGLSFPHFHPLTTKDEWGI